MYLAGRGAAAVLLAVAVAVPGRGGFAIVVGGTVAVAIGIATHAARLARHRDGSYQLRWYNRPIVYLALAGVGVGLQVPYHMLMSEYVAQQGRILTDAMAPALLAGDRVYAVPITSPPVRGTNVMYHLWGTTYVKRVLGLPHDTLAMRGGTLSVNGRSVSEPYATHTGEHENVDRLFAWQRRYLANRSDAADTYAPTLTTWGPLVVPEHAYFVLGDNRGESMDSRYHGFLPDSAISGRPVVIYFSRDRTTGSIRWPRIGQAIR